MVLLIVGVVIAAIILIASEMGLIKPDSYGENLEAYIERGMPQHPADVERLSREFQHRQGGKFI